MALNTTSNITDKFGKKVTGQDAVRAVEDSLCLCQMKKWMIFLNRRISIKIKSIN